MGDCLSAWYGKGNEISNIRKRRLVKQATSVGTSRTTRLIVKVKVIFGPRRLLLIVSTFDIYSMSMRSL